MTTTRALRPGTWSEAALKVLRERYLRPVGPDQYETPEEMCWRVANAIAQAESEWGTAPDEIAATAQRFYAIMIDRLFLPNSPTLMNAGLDNHLQYSACFVLPVEDSINGIFDAIRRAAIIHQSGGGCVAAHSYVYTTFCGVERIETLYQRVKAAGRPEQIEANHAWIDVTDLNIQTLSMSPATGRLEPRRVTHLWRWQVPAENQVTIRGSEGLTITTSSWHPFLVFTGRAIVERRADQLQPGDLILTANMSAQESWPFTVYQEQEGLHLDEDLAWLIGYFLGDGSLDVFHNRQENYTAWRLRFFDGRRETINHAARLLARFGINVTPAQDKRGLWRLATTHQAFVRPFARLAEVTPGPKHNLTLPALIAKSPLSVIGAFLAGLVDSDGYVSLERRRVEVSTVCPSLAEKLLALVSTLGLEPTLGVKAPHGKGKSATYIIKLAHSKKTYRLVQLILPFIHDPFRHQRLEQLRVPVEHDTRDRLPIPFAAVEDLLSEVGIETHHTAIHKSPVKIAGQSFWLHRWKWETGVSTARLKRLLPALRQVIPERSYPRLELLERVADGCAVVRAVTPADQPTTFYDFTVEGYNNYLAGNGQMVVVHNTGFAFSRLRPKDCVVKTSGGKASGPVSFLRVFDAATEAVKQGGRRRGANMAILRVDHPDILEFIDCKRDGGITNFNISVAITDRFMQALERGEDYDLVAQPGWPRPEGGRYSGGEVIGHLAARTVWERIVDAAWSSGDPGLMFIDKVNHSPANPVPHRVQIESTNPCVTGDTLIYTENGLVAARTLCALGQPLRVITDGRLSPAIGHDASPVFCTGRRPVYRLRTREGYSLRLTADHRVMTDRGWVAAGELRPGDRLHLLNRKGGFGNYGSRELGLALGWLVGDGTIRDDRAVLSFFGPEKRDLVPLFAEPVNALVDGMQQKKRAYPVTAQEITGRDEARLASTRLKTLAARHGLVDNDHKHQVSVEVLAGSEAMQRGFLQALFTADGTVSGTSAKGISVRLAQNNERLLEQVQLLLLNFGIASRLYRHRRPAGPRPMPDAQRHPSPYWCAAQHELVISKANLIRFQTEIGFLTHEKNARLAAALSGLRRRGPYRESFTARFESLTEDGIEEVYDLVEPQTHAFVANGLVVHNCGEQALPPSDACNLGSINLAQLAGSGNSHGPIKWDQLEEVTRLAVRFLDDVITVNPFPLKEIQETVLRSRRIGLGIMGWADLLFRLGIPYDSEEAINLAGEIMAFIQRVAQEETCRLAEERGAFPLWSESIYKDDRPRRNATLTTIAPTGTISIIADCSSGIEPVFALAYEHRVKQPDGEERRLQFINPIFVETAQREGFYSEEMMAEVVRRGTVSGVAGVPERWQRVFVTAHEVSPEWHVRMQAAWQAHVDNGVSKTVNLPHEATRDDVDRIYRLAYSLNCRGITVFRDGCKETQVLHVGTEKGKGAGERGSGGEKEQGRLSPYPPAPLQPSLFPMVQPRPQVMRGATHRVSTPLGTAYITINETDEGQPFEVFANVGKAGSDTAAVAEALGRLISLCLRLPSSLSARERLETIIGQLAGIGGGRPTGFGPSRVRSLPDGIARALAEHLGMHLNGEPAIVIEPTRANVPAPNPVGDLCPECGNATFVNEEGCHKCHTCGYSEC